jgi:hypothetical protein
MSGGNSLVIQRFKDGIRQQQTAASGVNGILLLKQIFKKFDVDGSGFLSWDEVCPLVLVSLACHLPLVLVSRALPLFLLPYPRPCLALALASLALPSSSCPLFPLPCPLALLPSCPLALVTGQQAVLVASSC